MDNNTEKEKNNQKKILIIFGVFIIALVVALAGFKLAGNYFETPKTTQPQTLQSTQPKTAQELVDNPIDFDSLQMKNPEIYAWIKIDGTKVDHPIVQSRSDDSFYLKHRAEDKSWSASGAVYTELANSRSFNDPITLIYGHNGYSDTFFTTLHYFEKEDFFNSHEYFYIYTPSRRLTYQVISAFKYDNRHILNSFDFEDKAILRDFQQELLNPESSLVNSRQSLDVPINEDSKIVILSTCITNQRSSRYLVSGVLVKDEKTN